MLGTWTISLATTNEGQFQLYPNRTLFQRVRSLGPGYGEAVGAVKLGWKPRGSRSTPRLHGTVDDMSPAAERYRCIYIYTYTCVDMFIRVSIHICIYVNMCMYVYIYSYID